MQGLEGENDAHGNTAGGMWTGLRHDRQRVRNARKAKKVTQEELSEHCGCTPTHICNLENGKIGVSLELLFKISLYLGKSMDYFVMDNENANPQIKIENNIAPKLEQCDTQMLDMVDSFIDGLITYKEKLSSSLKKDEWLRM